MSILIRLYPRAWRDRYEAEARDLLAQRPGSIGDSVDLIRGAADAHVHPQGGPPIPWSWRLPGLLSLSAGLCLVLAAIGISFGPGPDWGAGESFLGAALMLMLVSLPGDYLGEQRRRLMVAGGVFVGCVVAARLLGWGVPATILGSVAVLLAVCGTLATAALRAGISARGRWALVLGGVLLPLGSVACVTLVRETTGVALLDVTASTMALFALPYGLAWLLVGLRMTVRGSETIVDPPPSSIPAIPFDQEIHP